MESAPAVCSCCQPLLQQLSCRLDSAENSANVQQQYCSLSKLPPACIAHLPRSWPVAAPRPSHPSPLEQLELANMWKNGEIQDMWSMARQTHLTFNMVGSWAGLGCRLAWLAGLCELADAVENRTWTSVHALEGKPSIPSQACLTQLSAHAAMPTNIPASVTACLPGCRSPLG